MAHMVPRTIPIGSTNEHFIYLPTGIFNTACCILSATGLNPRVSILVVVSEDAFQSWSSAFSKLRPEIIEDDNVGSNDNGDNDDNDNGDVNIDDDGQAAEDRQSVVYGPGRIFCKNWTDVFEGTLGITDCIKALEDIHRSWVIVLMEENVLETLGTTLSRFFDLKWDLIFVQEWEDFMKDHLCYVDIAKLKLAPNGQRFLVKRGHGEDARPSGTQEEIATTTSE